MSHLSKAVLAMIGVTVACSRSASQSATSKSSAGSAAPTAVGAVSKVNVCGGQIITKAEAAEVVGGEITEIALLPGDAQSCVFKSTGFPSLTISLRPGLGTVTVQTWLGGKMPISGTALSGVGEQAVWVGELKEVVATKNNLLCDISAAGSGVPSDVAQKKIGAMCNKIFAAAS